ncbi:hypothetical protein V8C86DRAFT_3030370 [Haematococcus lacustris]
MRLIRGVDNGHSSVVPWFQLKVHANVPTSLQRARCAAQAVNRRKLQEQHRRQKRAAAELSITMRFASTETRQRCKATAVEQQLAAKELANNRARMATQQVQAMAMYSSTIQPLPQNTLKLTLHQLRHLWGVVGKGPQTCSKGTPSRCTSYPLLGCASVGMYLHSAPRKFCMFAL